MNIEIYNYLNLINYRLAKMYKKGLYNPFSDNFYLTEEMIKERLIFSQFKIKLPDFIFEEKKKIKKYFKNSQKNTKKMIKNLEKSEFSDIFNKKLKIYLILRSKLNRTLIRDFRNQDFDENDAILQIYQLDPVMTELLLDLFTENCDIEKLLSNLETSYTISYSEKIKLIEKKNNQASKKLASKTTTKKATKIPEKKKVAAKISEKTPKKIEKVEKTIKTSTTKTKNTKNKEI